MAPDGSTTLPERLVSPARVPAGTSPVTLTLPGIVHEFAAGHPVRLTIASTDNAYINSRLPGVITFPITPANPDVLTLPMAGSSAGFQDVLGRQPDRGAFPFRPPVPARRRGLQPSRCWPAVALPSGAGAVRTEPG